jgi:hypothetical protein
LGKGDPPPIGEIQLVPALGSTKKRLRLTLRELDKYRIESYQKYRESAVPEVPSSEHVLGFLGKLFDEDMLEIKRRMESFAGRPHLQGDTVPVTSGMARRLKCAKCHVDFCDSDRIPIVILLCGDGYHRECLAQMMAGGSRTCVECKDPLFGK